MREICESIILHDNLRRQNNERSKTQRRQRMVSLFLGLNCMPSFGIYRLSNRLNAYSMKLRAMGAKPSFLNIGIGAKFSGKFPKPIRMVHLS